ncbi:lytic transglycosylase domain-containing protein [Hippea maritima]|uniref:Lytic transglycosylase catalytic n=1 Tax=Hippea maritima (strain ATCC 700847 / DSM 10411 / MH2) TaxID=760142 RepID=F2LY25_HIPMA|nr:lytic transglycosylase domain-containing protein [Hippea maritima]AEA33290.1 Lytic transglycosylase catalytic [Hippea maritima DSM 10411]
MMQIGSLDALKSKTIDIGNIYKLKEACRQFESLFISKLLSAMEKTVPEDPIVKNDAANSIYKSMYINALSQKMSQNSPFGIAKTLFDILKDYVNYKTHIEKTENKPINLKTQIEFKPLNKDKFIKIDEKAEIIQKAINDASKRFHVPKKLLYGIIKAESGFNPSAVSKAGAIGLMQLMPQTAIEMGVKNIWDIRENILGGARYISKLIKEFKDYKKALAAYNAGPGNVKKYGGIPPFKETQNYIKKVLAYADEKY